MPGVFSSCLLCTVFELITRSAWWACVDECGTVCGHAVVITVIVNGPVPLRVLFDGLAKRNPTESCKKDTNDQITAQVGDWMDPIAAYCDKDDARGVPNEGEAELGAGARSALLNRSHFPPQNLDLRE